MKSWMIASLLAVFGFAAPSDLEAVVGQDDVNTMLANVGRNMADVAVVANEMPVWGNIMNANDAKNNNNNNNNKLRRTAATTIPFSQSVIGWSAGSQSCAAAAPTITISCATGGVISLVPNGQIGVSKCVASVKNNTITCTKLASSVAAYVVARCTGSSKYSIAASLPKYKFTNCQNNVRGNFAYQLIILAQLCAIQSNVKNYTGVYSKQCGVASQLHIDGNNHRPSCLSLRYDCVNTTTTTCAITTDAVKISTPVPTSALCIIK